MAASVAAPVNPEAFFGMLGPLVSAVATWIVAFRTWAAAPERLTGVMVDRLRRESVVLRDVSGGDASRAGLRPIVFVVSFAGFFIALHVIEALFLKRLFVAGSPAAPRA